MTADIIHLLFTHPLFFLHAEIAEDKYAFAVCRLIRHAWNDVEMDVRMFFRLGELNYIGLKTAGDRFLGGRSFADE